MRVNILGVLELPNEDFREEKPLLLLAYLAHNASDGWLPSEAVAELIWASSNNPVHNLNQAVHTLYKHAGARSHIRRRAGSIKVVGVMTDAQELLEACDRRDIMQIKQLYSNGQFLQSLNPDPYVDLDETWLLPMQKKLQAAVWRAYLEALGARPDNVAERLGEAYALTTVLPEPDSDDFVRCVCLQRLFGDKGSPFDRALQQEIDDLNIAPLPESDGAARAFLGLLEEGLMTITDTEGRDEVGNARASSPVGVPTKLEVPTKRLSFRRLGLAVVASVLLLAVGLGVWRGGSVAETTDGQVDSSLARVSITDRPRLDLPVGEALLAEIPQTEDPKVALLLAAEAAYALQPVAAGAEATETLREELLSATESWQTQLAHNALYLNFSSNGRWLVVAGEDSVAQVWDMQSAADEPHARLQHGENVSAAVFSSDGDTLVTGSGEGKAHRWSMDDLTQPLQTFEHESLVNALAESPDGRWLATGTLDGKARLWSLENPEAPPVNLRDHVGWVTSFAFSPDGSLLLTGDDQRGINLYRFEDGKLTETAGVELLEASTIKFGQDLPLVISPDGKWAAAGRPDSAVHLFDLSDPENKQKILQGHRDHVQSLIFSPDGRWLASGSRDGDVRVWETAGDLAAVGAEKYVLQGHEGWVMKLTLSEDGRYLLSGSDDATVRLWDMALTPPEARVFSDHPHQVRAVALNSAGWLATGSYEGDVLVQNIERSRYDLVQASLLDLISVTCQVVRRNLTRREWSRLVGEVPYRETCPRG